LALDLWGLLAYRHYHQVAAVVVVVVQLVGVLADRYITIISSSSNYRCKEGEEAECLLHRRRWVILRMDLG
jgi:hypothetical protein